MEAVKRSGDYATTQVEVLLSGLADSSHGSRVKAIKKFQEYMQTSRPEVYDDDVDIIYKGKPEVGLKGLCAWAGMPSDKHPGQLKRTANNAVSLLRWLVTVDDDEPDRESLFYNRFVCLPAEEIIKIGFERHAFTSSDKSRAGNRDDAFELLSIVLVDHRSLDNEPQPIPIEILLPDESARVIFATWQQEFAATKLKQHLAVLPVAVDPKVLNKRHLPTCWSQVTLDDDVTGLVDEYDDDVAHAVVKQTEVDEASLVVPDPLDVIEGVDLRATQASHVSTFQGMRRSRRTARASIIDPFAVLMARDGLAISSPPSRRASIVSQLSLPHSDNDKPGYPMAHSTNSDHLSVVPSDKTFSPELFLTLVHSNTTFHELSVGLKRLGDKLEDQKQQRKHLVREHYGLYVQCAEGIDWLKRKMQEEVKMLQLSSAQKGHPGGVNGDPRAAGKDSFFELRLHRANDLFTKAAEEARGTLRPLLDSMEKANKIKAAEHVLKRLAPLMELPLKMKEALKDGRHDDVLAILKRIITMTKGSSLKLIEQVASKAAEIGLELRTTLAAQLVDPQTDHVILLNKLHLLLELQCLDEILPVAKTGKDAAKKESHPMTCFQHQLKHFVGQLEEAQRTNLTDMTEAFMKAREQEIDSNDPQNEHGANNTNNTNSNNHRHSAKHARSASGSLRAAGSNDRDSFSSSRRRSSFDINSGRRSSLRPSGDGGSSTGYPEVMFPMSLLEGSDDEMENLTPTGRGEDDDNTLGMNSDDDDMLGVDIEDDAASMETGSLAAESLGNAKSPIAEFQAAAGVDQVTHECSLVRLRHVQKIVEHLARWLPCLHSLVFEVQRSVQQEASLRTAADRRNRWINEASNGSEISPEKQLSNAIQTASDVIRKAILGTNSVSPSEHQRSSATTSKPTNARAQGILNHPVHTQGLVNPYLHHAVQEVSNLFEIVESLLGRSQDSPYFAAISDLLLVTKEGETAHAQRLVEVLDQNLLTIANEKLRENNSLFDDHAENKRANSDDHHHHHNGNKVLLRCKMLQHHIGQMLLVVQETCPHLDWSADIIKTGIRSCVLHFLQALARHVSAWEHSVLWRGQTGEYFGSDEHEDILPLQVIRACFELRKNIIPVVEGDVERIFPTFDFLEEADDIVENTNGELEVMGDAEEQSNKSQAAGVTKLFGGASITAPSSEPDHLFRDAYDSVDALEASALKAYLQVQHTHAQLVVKAAWLKPAAALRMAERRLANAKHGLAPHMSRILYLVVTVRTRVLSIVGSQYTDSKGATYETQILNGVSQGIVQSYKTVIGQLVRRPCTVFQANSIRNELHLLSDALGEHYTACSSLLKTELKSLETIISNSGSTHLGNQLDQMMAEAQIFLNALSPRERS